jgi:hypothetical protein
VPFTTLDEFNDLGDEILPDESNFVILLLQGYPEAQWLAAVGAKFRIDPEFFHRHLIFTSTIDQYDSMKRRTIPRNTPTNMPSPCDEGLMSVQITRVGHWGDRYIGPVGWLMRRTEVRMREERFNMAQLYPDSKSKPRHRSIIREFSHHRIQLLFRGANSVNRCSSSREWVDRYVWWLPNYKYTSDLNG